MTNRTSDQIRADIAANSRELMQAKEDAALLKRLKNAASEIARCNNTSEALLVELNEATAAEAEIREAAFAATFRNLKVTAFPSAGPAAKPGVMGLTINITYEAPRWCMSARDSVWTEVCKQGFQHIDRQLLGYILDKRPELIPHEILALSNDGPHAAMERYLLAQQRGFLRS